MRYTTPNVLATVNATAAIQNGTGATSQGGTKAAHLRDNVNKSIQMSTTAAYEADE
jgi:hypothetical protein